MRLRGVIGAALVSCLSGLLATAANARPLGEITTFPVPAPSTELRGITSGPDGNLWFADQSREAVGRITLQGQVTEFPSGVPNHGATAGITQGPDHNIWFADQGGAAQGGVGRTTPQGQSTVYPVPVTTNPHSYAWGIAPGWDGNVWFADRGCENTGATCAIGKVTPQGAITEYTSFPRTGAKPFDVAKGPDGNVWFTDYGSKAIGKITPGGVITEYTIPYAGASPSGITLGPNGNLWFTDFANKAIGEVTPQGQITELTAGIPQKAALGEIARGPDGNVWFVDYGTPAIGRITPQGQVTEFSSGLPARSRPDSITPGADGSMWATEVIFDGSGNPSSTAIERIGTGFPPAVAKPTLSGLRVTPKKSSVAGRRVRGHCVKRTHKNRGHKRCRRAIKLRIGFTLNTAATVTLTFTKQKPGRRVKKGCVKPNRKNRKHRSCTRNLRLPGHITLSATPDANTFIFHSKVGGHKLGPGRYRVTVLPGGGTPKTAQFRLVG